MTMNHFKGKQFQRMVIDSRGYYLHYNLAIVSSRNLMIVALTVSHTTIYRWVQNIANDSIKFGKEK